MKTREEQLEAWKAKRTKPLAAIGNSNVLNRPPKPPVKRLAVLLKGSSGTDKQVDATCVDKENQQDQPSQTATAVNRSSQSTRIPRAKQVAADFVETAGSKSQLPAVGGLKFDATQGRKTAVSASTLENMENQFDMLKGTLDTLKRESIRY